MKEIFKHWAKFSGLTFSDLRDEKNFIVITLESYILTMHDLKRLESYIKDNNLKLDVYSIDAINNSLEVWLWKQKDDNYKD